MIGRDWKFGDLKISPLASWDRQQVWAYIKGNKAPYNELHERGFTPPSGPTHLHIALKVRCVLG